MNCKPQLITLTTDTLDTEIEYQWLNPSFSDAPLLVFLHEGLGSLSMWKQFPQQLCDALNCQGLVYSRPAYGNSTPRSADEKWGLDFMHRQAYEVLPALLSALSVDTTIKPPWLFGHSDGASIALLYASKFPKKLAGAIVLAPHILVEAKTITSIEQARNAYQATNLREQLAKYHTDIDSTFWGWIDIWLNTEFLEWNIETDIKNITCPLFAVQGLDDEYGTMKQIRNIKNLLPHTELLELPDCGHSCHRDQTEALIMATNRFILNHT